MPRKVYERPYYDSIFTQKVMDQFPSWMDMRKNIASNGWQVANAMWSHLYDKLSYNTKQLADNRFINIVHTDLQAMYKIGRIELVTSSSVDTRHELPEYPTITATTNSKLVDVSIVDTLEQFEKFPPTRCEYLRTVSVTDITTYGDIKGITFAKDFTYLDPETNETIKVPRSWMINVPSGVHTLTYIYDTSASSYIGTPIDIGYNNINTETVGNDEVLDLAAVPSGSFYHIYEYSAVLQNQPAASSMYIYDIGNLGKDNKPIRVDENEYHIDPDNKLIYFNYYSGNRPSYNPGYYVETGTAYVVPSSTVSPIYYYPSGYQPSPKWDSTYIVEYQTLEFEDARQITSSDANIYGTPVYGGRPYMAETPPSGLVNKEVPFIFADDPYSTWGYDKILLINPISTRPGRSVTVEFDYTSYWDTTFTPGDTITVPAGYEFAEQGVHIFDSTGTEITKYFILPNYAGNKHIRIDSSTIYTTPVYCLQQPNSDSYLLDIDFIAGRQEDGRSYTFDIDLVETGFEFDPSLSEANRKIAWPDEYIVSYLDWTYQLKWNTTLSLRIYYKNTTTKTITTVSSNNCIPSEYMLQPRRTVTNSVVNEYWAVIPYTCVPLIGIDAAESDALQRASMEQFRVLADSYISGIAYEKERDRIWYFDNNNFTLYNTSPNGESAIGKNILRPPDITITPSDNLGVALIDSNGHPVEVICEQQDIPGILPASGIVYYQDFMHVMYDKNIYRINVYDEDGDYNSHSFGELCPSSYSPTGIPVASSYLDRPVDITVDDEGNLLVADRKQVKMFSQHRDCAYLDRTARVLYLREIYDTVTSSDLGLTAQVPYIHNVWNQLDETGLVLGTDRIPGESNVDYMERLRDVLKHRGTTTVQGLINGLSRDMKLTRYDI